MAIQSPKASNFLSDVSQSTFDLRAACNVLKRTSMLSTASILTGADTRVMEGHVERLSIEVLSKLGFSTQDHQRMGSLLAMITEPISMVVAEAALAGATSEQILSTGTGLVQTIVNLANSRISSKIINEYYPSDIDAATSIRMTSAMAICNLANEVEYFDFGLGSEKCIKEGAAHITKSAYEAAEYLIDKSATSSSRKMMIQSLLNSAGKLYATCYRSVSGNFQSSLLNLTEQERSEQLLLISKMPASKVMGEVNKRFHTLFDASINSCAEMAIVPEIATNKSNHEPENKSGMRP